jgi:7,8-dihydropterin-6-yl-methyl-4-(beta-D-ribofuranosyl)aminobenzene 5'-phosphate synthase
MKITVLTDNHAGTRTQAEHGLSLLIEYDGKKILFDTGQSDLFLRNAASLVKTDHLILLWTTAPWY